MKMRGGGIVLRGIEILDLAWGELTLDDIMFKHVDICLAQEKIDGAYNFWNLTANFESNCII